METLFQYVQQTYKHIGQTYKTHLLTQIDHFYFVIWLLVKEKKILKSNEEVIEESRQSTFEGI